jgi:hypothetical protein
VDLKFNQVSISDVNVSGVIGHIAKKSKTINKPINNNVKDNRLTLRKLIDTMFNNKSIKST